MTGRVRALAVTVLTAVLSLAPMLLPMPRAWSESTPPLPVSVPGVRQWQPAAGGYELPGEVRIVAAPGAEAIAGRFAEDLTRAGRNASVASGPARAGDVVIRVDGSGPDRDESYRLDIDETVTATARTRAGAVHATQTLLQWFSQGTALPHGTVTDWPDYAERGLLLDVGREYMSVGFIEQRIRELAYYRMNMLHLHLSDVGGFRLESASHPEITSPQHYSKAEIAEIVSYAADYGIEVVPEIGFPGHMNAILAAHPDLVLNPATTGPLDAATDNLLTGSAAGRIDLSKPQARSLIEDLLREFVPLFPGRYFHLGGDEYVKDFSRYPQLTDYAHESLGPGYTAEDAVAAFFDHAAGIVASYGKVARMWNDGIPHGARVVVDPAIIVDHWTGGNGILPWAGNENGPEQLVDAGHRISNAAFTPTYWASGGYAAPLNAPPELLFAWDPGLFVNGSRLRPDQRDHLLGSALNIWCDDPTALTEDQMVAPIRARLPIMSQQLWSGTAGLGYSEFTDRVRTAGLPR
ncbi:family 20 glycosylhydrolase [Nocardia sp. NPDC059240]|uniref:family 20 glycosylhydrolase n=1 Tax=Nocardia sp. NPDC059240 TaxID=3346786 RepID=UPI00367D41F3